jgi:predicted permease
MFESSMKVPGLGTVIRSLRDYQIGGVKLAARLLLGSTLSILLIVCANVANLLLARSAGLRREVAVRAALGAQRRRLFQQNFAESVLLTGSGAVLGTAFGWALLQIFKSIAPTGIPRIHEAALDGRVLLAVIFLSFLLATSFAWFTALEPPKPELLTTGGRVAGTSKLLLRRVLTVAQVAVSLVLLCVAGLLMESLANLENVSPGIAVDHVTTAEIAVGPPRYSNTTSRQQFFETLSGRLRELPGFKAVALSDTAPPIGFIHTRPARTLRALGQPMSEPAPAGIVAWRSVSPDYFAALGIPILRGRPFNSKDQIGKDNPIIINETWAHHLFGNEDAIGRGIRLGSDTMLTVVGVSADVKNNGLSQPPDPEYYIVRKQVTDPNEGRDEALASRALHWYGGEAFVIVRSAATPDAVANWIRSVTAAMDPTVPVAISTMRDRLATLSERPRFTTLLLCFFAFAGLVLAAAGLYGLISFLVAQRTQEMGIRMAVGATPAQIAGLMLKHSLYWTLSGVLIGCAVAALVVRSLRTLVFKVPVENPALFALVACLMIAVALAAALVPSLRAARVDPIAALRQE